MVSIPILIKVLISMLSYGFKRILDADSYGGIPKMDAEIGFYY